MGASEYISRVQGTSKPACDPGTNYNSPNNKLTTSYDRHTINLAYNRPPPLLTLPTQHASAAHQLIATPHPLRNISSPIRLPFHCTPIPHQSMLSLIQPGHPQLLLNPIIRLKNLYSYHKCTVLLFPA